MPPSLITQRTAHPVRILFRGMRARASFFSPTGNASKGTHVNAARDILSGLVELHVHSSPDVRIRRMDDVDLMETAVSNNVRAIVIKSHVAPTACRAAIINRVRKEKYPYSDFEMFGGVTLNKTSAASTPTLSTPASRSAGKSSGCRPSTRKIISRKKGNRAASNASKTEKPSSR